MAKKTKKINFKLLVVLAFMLAVSIFFWTTSLLFVVCMLPSIVYWCIDKTIQKSKTLTIASMNFIGCFYYLSHVWVAANPIEKSIEFLSNPVTIIVCYMMAILGYVINYITVFTVSSFDKEKAENRISQIEKEKSTLEKRWGKKVNGEVPLDDRGFPIELGDNATADET